MSVNFPECKASVSVDFGPFSAIEGVERDAKFVVSFEPVALGFMSDRVGVIDSGKLVLEFEWERGRGGKSSSVTSPGKSVNEGRLLFAKASFLFKLLDPVSDMVGSVDLPAEGRAARAIAIQVCEPPLGG